MANATRAHGHTRAHPTHRGSTNTKSTAATNPAAKKPQPAEASIGITVKPIITAGQ
ncbi:hypothetical protein GCM10027589_22280 [Actinocorallia lasiicapitis]